MDSSTSSPCSRSPVPASRFLQVGINPSIGPIRCTTTCEIGKRPRTIFQSARDKELAHTRELYRQEQLVEHENCRKQLVSSSEYSTALDIKDCVLQVQRLCLRDLAVKENHIKGFAGLPDAITTDLEKSYKEVDRVVSALHCRERRSDRLNGVS